jgi:hypothetical protein
VQNTTLAAAWFLPIGVHAAELPKEGTDTFSNIWVSTISNSMQQGANAFLTYESNGITLNDAGGPMFNLFGLRCVGIWDGRGGGEFTDRGTCTYTDKDGDHIFAPNTSKGWRGMNEAVGGTGKFAGITGADEYNINNPGQIKWDDKRNGGFVSSKISWKLSS